MLLFFTREALWSLSMEERRWGEGEVVVWPPPYGTVSELRFCQNSLGEEPESTGDDWNGDESLLSADFYIVAQES